MPITRTGMIDDDGSGTTGTILNNAWKQELYNQIDALAGASDVYPIEWTANPNAPSIGNGTLASRWITVGPLVYLRVQIIAGSTTNFGNGGWVFSLPFPNVPARGVFTGGTAFSGAAAYAVHGCYAIDAGHIALFAGPVGSAGVSMDVTHPFAWGPGTWLDYHILYTRA